MKILKKFLKCILAGIVAVAILSLILAPYSLMPVHVENTKQNTDYVWTANSLWSRMTEGISFGKFDSNGYNNAQVVENPDILVLGSSHTEGINVLQSENFAALLGQEFEGTYTTYNMGISGHFFIKVCKYLQKNAELYPDAKYIVIETDTINFTEKAVDSLLNGTVEFTPSNSESLIGMLQKLPFARIVYHQLISGLLDMLLPQKAQEESISNKPNSPTLPDEAVYDALFSYIQESLKDSDAQLIVTYHPTGTILEDGSVSFIKDEAALSLFSRKCQEYGVSFVDMTEPFAQMYATEHKLPHGFVTGPIGSGHLNADGHRKIAEELAQCIIALKEEG